MFESLTHWFESLGKESKLFNDPEDEVLHGALASVLYHIISADKHVIEKEKHKFSSILKQEFDLDDDQVDHLYLAAKSSTSDPHSDLETVNQHLKKNPQLRMNFMKKLNQLIDLDGVQDSELDIFYEALNLVFPDLKR
ncbi:MAG: hypothetical protein HOM14_02300 [Gammaproteobacteria bacterium]|jgi:uncharacterized tellurite resistance protein B-like protein|nr:hypothetical protein [Gammaproteobacteria bacterium]MBT3724725.1 hypothetical protein [Gammaproteobacteria bacterium]MBT4078569.1 hypothetical protein [Gammaproteobacteria bacterium]MBT4192830.1 hypothetical protein [Gammaproteobacteria bacterium]MBT4448751.1 hypothetical protein [Gammaproteobacteria bacterium]